MSTIKVKDAKSGMLLDIDDLVVLITEAWPDQGNGLGIMIKGETVEKGASWGRRFINVNTELVRISSHEDILKYSTIIKGRPDK